MGARGFIFSVTRRIMSATGFCYSVFAKDSLFML